MFGSKDKIMFFYTDHSEKSDLLQSDLEMLSIIRRGADYYINLEDVMDKVWEFTTGKIPHDRIGLAFIEHDDEKVFSRFYRTNYEKVYIENGYNSGLSGSSLERLINYDGYSIRVINDLKKYYSKINPSSVSTRLLIEEGINSSITVPLKVGKRKIGFLFFSSKEIDTFTAKHCQLLLLLTKAISPNIEKNWYINTLEKSRQDFNTLLGFISHEMKSPLNALITVGKTYLGGYLGDVSEPGKSTVEKMSKSAGYLVNMIQNYLDLSHLDSGEMKFNPVTNINLYEEILSFALDTVKPRADERGTKFSLSNIDTVKELTCDLDIDLLRIVAINLVDNAVKYGIDNGEVTVNAYYDQNLLSPDKKCLVFKVENQGIGFSEESKNKLFKRFSRLKEKGTEKVKGTGLGLYLTWWIVQKHKGVINADSIPNEKTTFTVILPVSNSDRDIE